jgi:hypothetical protein
MAKRSLQLKLLKTEASCYGGSLLTTRKGRSRPRPLAVRSSMHLVMRSSRAVGSLSFRLPKNSKCIDQILGKFSKKYSVKILSTGNAGNHLHFHIQLLYRDSYRPFIRAISSAIALAVTGVSRWNRAGDLRKMKFWDRRPFTRILSGFRDRLALKDYIEINQLEGFGNSRGDARDIIAEWKGQRGPPLWR